MKNLLVTGNKGFIGNELIKKLDNSKYNIFDSGIQDGINYCDLKSVLSLPKTDIIVHLAAKSFIPDSFKRPDEFYYNNFVSTLNILEKARLDNSKLIFFSTYVYGTPKYLPIDEIHPPNPLNPYTQSKLICENLIESYSRDFGLNSIIFRPFNIYGTGQKESFIIPTILGKLKNGLIELNDPRPKRDYIHINDVVDAIIAAFDFDVKGCEVFNLGSGVSTDLKTLIDIILKEFNSYAVVNYSNVYRQGEVLDTIANINKIKNVMDWSPRFDLSNGIRLMKDALTN